MSLITHLKMIRDFRTTPDYPLWLILVLVIMSTLSGHHGYRPTADFVSRHQTTLLEVLAFSHPRLPSLSTIRRVMVHLDFQALTRAFNAWAIDTVGIDYMTQLATDGKSVKASLKDYDQSYQDFVGVVSAFNVQQGEVVALQAYANGSQSEIEVVQNLLEHLQLTGVCFSMDALHTQKKRCNKSSRLAMITSSPSKGTNRRSYEPLSQPLSSSPH